MPCEIYGGLYASCFQHLIFIQRSMQPVKKMVSIFQRNDTIRRRVKRRYSNLPQIFFSLCFYLFTYLMTKIPMHHLAFDSIF